MIPVTVMVTGSGTVSQKIKGKFGPGNPSRFSNVFRPVIVWNMTYRCNLRCLHCYIKAGYERRDTLSFGEALSLIDQIYEVKSPLLILSGGEPIIREDFKKVSKYASDLGLNLVLSTNGTLINKDMASFLSDIGFKYVGVSLDSDISEWHDYFRGVEGSFSATLRGIKNCLDVGIPTGIRYTITSQNVDRVSQMIRLALKLGVSRITFYHLSASGRAKDLGMNWYLNLNQYKKFMDLLISVSERYFGRIEIETTLAPFDGIYIADKISKDSKMFWTLIYMVKSLGGCGRKIISIYPDGKVYPCQFVDFMVLGDLRKDSLRDILDVRSKVIKYFIETEKYLKGERCSKCHFKEICKGGDRVRAYYLGGSLYGDDPMCFLNTASIYERWVSTGGGDSYEVPNV